MTKKHPHTAASKAALPSPHAALQQMLRQAEVAFKADGADAALAALGRAPLTKPETREVLSDAERLALLGRSVSDRDPKTALSLAKHATGLDNRCMEAWLLAGYTQDKLGYRKGASLAFAQVVKSRTAQPVQVLQAANMLVRMGDQALALKAAKAAFKAMGKPLGKVSSLLYIAQKTADWALMDELTAQLSQAYQEGRFDEARESTRTHVNWCANEHWNQEVIRRWNLRSFPRVSTEAPRPQPLQGRRLRVGYLSSDFREHPTSRLVNGLFRHHDRSQLELFMYCSGWNDGSALRREVESHFDHIHSVARLSDAEAADLIRSHQIDVLVELNGPTRANRMGILTHRPAPVQIDYLGWPGSVGGRVVDAIVADPYVVPAQNEALYPEQLIRLNKTYQVNDYAARQKPVPPSRSEAKLPEGDWLILGMFNGIEKASNAVWAAWMAILKQVPHALIWLLDPGEVAKRHIAQITQAHGIDPSRIVLAPRKPQDVHLARLGLCDLMLDPWPYGGHTTTSDALFAGVPVLALEGTNFASRVSGSLLNAAGLGDLVVKDVPSYIALGVKLLKHPAELKRLKAFIEQRVPKLDIFDSKGKARQLEKAYREAVMKLVSETDSSTLPDTNLKVRAESLKTTGAPVIDSSINEIRIPLVLVCSPWSSGTSAVAGMLALAGLQAPGPYARVRDARTPLTYEMQAFKKVLNDLASEKTLSRVVSDDEALQKLGKFRDDILLPYFDAKKGPLMLKHALSAFFLPQLARLFDLRVVKVKRPLREIESTRQRRNWPAVYGEKGASKVYKLVDDYLENAETPCVTIEFSELLGAPQEQLGRLLAFCGFESTQTQREAAVAFVQRHFEKEPAPEIRTLG